MERQTVVIGAPREFGRKIEKKSADALPTRILIYGEGIDIEAVRNMRREKRQNRVEAFAGQNAVGDLGKADLARRKCDQASLQMTFILHQICVLEMIGAVLIADGEA